MHFNVLFPTLPLKPSTMAFPNPRPVALIANREGMGPVVENDDSAEELGSENYLAPTRTAMDETHFELS